MLYRLTCPECAKRYTGQTGRNFVTRCGKHVQNKFKIFLTFENQHSVGTIDNTVEVLYTAKKGPHLSTVDKFYIYKETRNNNQLNDQYAVQPNAVFKTTLQHDSYDDHPQV